MKLKMAKNSLFAVLLRSPWWISMLLVAAFGIASAALLPTAYVPFGVMGALPFLVIGLIAAKRQWNVPSPTRVAETLAKVVAMPWRDFANALDTAYTAQGYTVTRLHGKAVDLALQKNGSTTLVACKRWKAANYGIDALRDVASAQELQNADRCIYIGLGNATDAARRFAQEQSIQLLSDTELAQLLK
ncbi:restriction endonuclease [Rhodoferax sp.]|uniref:restriction endonuclease n=1 Tax=Rhodoferax sp. TaxID=50421 RepID=UPI00374DF5EC